MLSLSAALLIPHATGVSSKEALRFAGTIEQARDGSCGFAVVAMLLSQYRSVDVTEEELIDRFVSKDDLEVTLLEMEHIVAAYGLKAQGYRLNVDGVPEALAAVGPIVVHLTEPYDHFVLVEAAIDGWFIVADPAAGRQVWDARTHTRRWSGAVLAVSGYAAVSGDVRHQPFDAAASRRRLEQLQCVPQL